jgi:hypothetical protein
MKKAKKIAKNKNIELLENARPIFENFDSFGLKWKSGNTTFYAKPDKNFWENWKKNKEQIKSAGFWVSKSEKTGEFFVFIRKNVVGFDH